MGLAMAMLIAIASMPSVQAHPAYVDSRGLSAISLPALGDKLDGFDGAVYLAEESELASAQKTPSHRLGGDLPLLTLSASFDGMSFAAFRSLQPEHPARASDGPFRSPHKTGPPHI